MKRLVSLMTLLTFLLIAKSQENYHPLLKVGKEWHEMSYNELYKFDVTEKIIGDTIINDKQYFNAEVRYTIYMNVNYDEGGFLEYADDYIQSSVSRDFPMREENGRVYRLISGKDVLIYDFNLLKDDKYGNQVVIDVDTIPVGGNKYKRLSISEIDQERYDWYVENGMDPYLHETAWLQKGYWVEGIGCNRGLTYTSGWSNIGGVNSMMSCYENNKLIFRASDFEHPGIHPMLKKGKEWVYDYYQFNDNEGKYNDPQRISYFIDGDTIINGKKYFTLVNTRKYPYPYCGAYREEGTTMYCVYPGQTEETVIQTFDPAGFPPEMAEFNTVQKDTIIVRDMPFVRYQYKAPKRDWALTAIEGVGFKDNGIVYGMSYGMPTCACDYMTLRYCIEDNCIIFTNEEFDTKQTDNIVQLRLASPIQESNASFFDLQGRRINGQPQKGMYIQGGKKFVK